MLSLYSGAVPVEGTARMVMRPLPTGTPVWAGTRYVVRRWARNRSLRRGMPG